MPYKYASLPQRRFVAGTGVRYMADGKTIRCHAVSRNKLNKLRKENPELRSKDVWPELQCNRAARPGFYVCLYHGAGRVGGPMPGSRKMVVKEARDISSFVSRGIADKYRVFVSDPEIFSQRQNIALLYARNAEILSDPAGDLTGDKARKALHKGLDMIEAGDPNGGSKAIREVLEKIDSAKETWAEFRQNADTIKNLTNAEVNRAKEMRLTLTSEQVLGMIDRLLNVVVDAIEKNIIDPKVQGPLISTIVGGARGIIGTSDQSLFGQPTGESGTDN
jgi:hypothetical protein